MNDNRILWEHKHQKKSNLDKHLDKHKTQSFSKKIFSFYGINFFSIIYFFKNQLVDLEHINTETSSIIICLQFSKKLLQA